ncbi:MAG: DUF3568 family protein [Nitrospirae bacterium]|nr:DUF3568 family protein [Nitrospirota bacterium]
MKKIRNLLFAVCVLFFVYGCELALVGVGAGAGVLAYKYVDGLLIKEYPVEYTKAWDAANTELSNLKISISDSSNEGRNGKINAVRSDGAKVVIALRDMGQKVTSIGIRVGTLGDRVEADKLHTAIASALGI